MSIQCWSGHGQGMGTMSKRSRKDGRRRKRRAGTHETSEAEVSVSEKMDVQEVEVIDIEIVDQGTPGVTITGEEPEAPVIKARKRPFMRKERPGKRRTRPAKGEGPPRKRRPEVRRRRPPQQETAKPFMSVSLIAAVAENGVIGRDGGIPWDLPNDRVFFKKVTMDHAVIMGRKTFESMGVLEGRTNIVISRDEDLGAEGVTVAHDIVDALIASGALGGEVFVAGGSEIYEQFLPLAEKLYITRIQGGFGGDARFPKIFWDEWKKVDSKPGRRDENNRLFYRFEVYER